MSAALHPPATQCTRRTATVRPWVDVDEFVQRYHPENRHDRTSTWSEDNPNGRWRSFGYDALTQRDKVNLDVFWLRDESLEDAANLPDPDIIAAEIIEDLGAALAQFELIQGDLAKAGEA
jgi:type I restriction enzyme M protein